MSDKVWLKADEWVSMASCGQDPRFTADVLTPEDVEYVEDTCGGCPVRPECIRDAVRHQWNSVWCAGEYIPDHFTADSRRRAKAVRLDLFLTIPRELSWRPDEVR